MTYHLLLCPNLPKVSARLQKLFQLLKDVCLKLRYNKKGSHILQPPFLISEHLSA
jgi:hypothetical protein